MNAILGPRKARMNDPTPERFVFRFHERFQLCEAPIIEAFLTSFSSLGINDYYSHLCPPDEDSNKMHIVLDIHPETIVPDNSLQIKYRVFKVKQDGQFYFTELNESACKYARLRCTVLDWGPHQRRLST